MQPCKRILSTALVTHILYCACYITWNCSAALLTFNMHCACYFICTVHVTLYALCMLLYTHCACYFIWNCSAVSVTCILHCACYIMNYCSAALKWLSNRNGIQALFFLYMEKKSFAPYKWYGGAMSAILEDSSMTNKGTKVRSNIYSKFCWLCYLICYVTASVCTVTGATVCWFVTDRSGWPLFWVKVSTVETETVQAIFNSFINLMHLFN